MCCQIEMMRSRFHAVGTSVKCSVCVGRRGKEVRGSKACFPIGDRKYSLHESAPPSCLKGGEGCYNDALSPLSAGEGGQWEAVWTKGGDTEQTMAKHLILEWAAVRCQGHKADAQSSHMGLGSHQLIPEGCGRITQHTLGSISKTRTRVPAG